jgi:hypothetical protein
MARLVAAVTVFTIALCMLTIGCGDGGSPETTASDGGSTMTSALPALPPIDLAAPATFETASFALG